MIKGEKVVVIFKRTEDESDAFGAPIETEEYLTVENVLVAPTKPEDILASNRLNGSLAKYTLYFPKSFREELRGADVEIRGKRHRVIGDPDHYDEVNVPGTWSMQVYVEVARG